MSEKQWNALVSLNDELLIAEKPLLMPRAKSEMSATNAKQKDESKEDEVKTSTMDSEKSNEGSESDEKDKKDEKDEESDDLITIKRSEWKALVDATKAGISNSPNKKCHYHQY